MMKTNIFFTLFLLLAMSLGTFSQESIEVNGYQIIEINGEYYDISTSDTLKIVSDVITVKYKTETTEQQIQTIEQTYNLQKTYHGPTGWINYKLDSITDAVDLVLMLSESLIVDKVLFSRYFPLFSLPNEQAWSNITWDYSFQNELCELNNGEIFWDNIDDIPMNISHVIMQVPLAWDITTGIPEIIIGFIDSGTNVDHEDLGYGGDTYHNLWEHPMTGDFGWNFVHDDNNVSGSDFHGTMVASLASAKTNNGIGTFGIAGGWGDVGAKAMTLKIAWGSGAEHLIHQALDYAVDNGARIVNMSFGTPINESVSDAIIRAYEEFNCVMFAATGNNNYQFVTFPASHEHVIAVGATNITCILQHGLIPYYIEEKRWGAGTPQVYPGSSFGDEVDIVALPYYYRCDFDFPDTYTQDFGATSGATAYASSIAALILSANPCLNNYEVAEILKNTAEKIDADNTTPEAQYDPVTGHSQWYGYGRINAYQAVLAALDKEGEPAYAVSGNETWNDRRRFSGNITVEDGGILTLASTLFMDSHTKIIVKPGGKLIVDGGTITTACLDPWQGIEVLGNPSLDQTPPSQQGWVVVNNGGTIAKALTGIRAGVFYDLPESDGSEIKFTGGIIQVNNAVFQNNKIAIEWLPYEHASISYVKNSTFTTDLNMPDAINPDYFIKLYGINIHEISNCEFINSRTWINKDDPSQGSGIYAWHANIKSSCASYQTPCPPTGYHPNTFNNLYRGIYALNRGSNRTVSIINHVFENTYRGLYLSGISDARITSNEFLINTPFEEEGGYGLYLDACNGYWVEDNEFKTDNTANTGIGIIVNDSGDDPNEIYRNRFIKLEQGISAQGFNRDPLTNRGLQILCNDFMNTGADILVANRISQIGRGIAAWQGDSTYMAGNLFHNHTAVDYNDINNEGEDIMYFYPLQNTDGRVVPQEITDNTVNPVPIYLDPPWDYAVGCPCLLESGGGGQTEELKQQMTESGQQADDLQESLDLMIDDGDTEGLHWDVQMSTSPQAMQVYDELMGASPWLSDTVASAAIIKEDVLVDAMLRDIMVANPHTAKSNQLMEELDQRWTPLPEYMKAQILQGKSMVSPREQTEALLAMQRLNKTRAVNSLARIWQDDADSLIWLWEGDNSLASKYKLAFLHIEQGQDAQGTSVLNNIPVQMNLNTAKQAVHQQIMAVYNILASLAQEGKSILEADSLQILTLQDIEEEANGIAGVYARNALLTLQMLAYDEPILLPDLMKSGTAAEAYHKLLETRPPKNLGVFPVPARDFIVVEYTLDAETKGSVEFTDATGRLVHTLKVSGPVNQELIDTRQWKPGWYIASLKIQAKTLESVKFIISD